MLSESVDDHYSPSIRVLDVEKNESGNCGFHLTRSKWDPYPWVSSVDSGSAADTAGLKNGDCVLEVNGEDVIGQRISEIANLVKRNQNVSLLLWNVGVDPQCSPETLCCGPMPRNLQRLIACMSSVLGFLECPICLDTIPPPCYQCDNGHLICMRCRAKSERCPVCRVRFTRGRSLLADQVYNVVTDAFDLKEETEDVRSAKMQQIFKLQTNKNKNIPGIKITQAHTNKFLARLVGKSSSVENLSSNKNATSTLSLDGLNSTLKTKSLSSNEIFDSSPMISRSNSMRRLNKGTPRASRDYLNVEQRPVSCHGSFESLNSKSNDDVSFQSELKRKSSITFCPFDVNCSSNLSDADVFEHFQEVHNGPLVQYFKPSITLNLGNIIDNDSTYVISFNSHTFFVKIFKKIEVSTGQCQDIHLWTWCLAEPSTVQNYHFATEIFYRNEQLINVYSPVYSVNTNNWQDMFDNKKGIIISGNLFEECSVNICETTMEINIINSHCK